LVLVLMHTQSREVSSFGFDAKLRSRGKLISRFGYRWKAVSAG